MKNGGKNKSVAFIILFSVCWIISRNHSMCHILAAGTVCLEIIFNVFDCIYYL